FLRKDGGVVWANVSTVFVPTTGNTPAFFAGISVDITERKRAEEALRESERRLQDIIDNTTAVIFVKDLELRYVLVNREYERLYHVQRDQIRGKTDFDIRPHDIAEAVRASGRKARSAGSTHHSRNESPSARSNSHDPKKSFAHCSKVPVRRFFYMTKMGFWRRIRVGCNFWAIRIWTMSWANAPSNSQRQFNLAASAPRCWQKSTSLTPWPPAVRASNGWRCAATVLRYRWKCFLHASRSVASSFFKRSATISQCASGPRPNCARARLGCARVRSASAPLFEPTRFSFLLCG